MSDVSINVKALEGAAIPEYKTAGAAGADVCALVESPVELNPGDRALIGTGLFFAIPDGYEIQVRPRSGLAATSRRQEDAILVERGHQAAALTHRDGLFAIDFNIHVTAGREITFRHEQDDDQKENRHEENSYTC